MYFTFILITFLKKYRFKCRVCKQLYTSVYEVSNFDYPVEAFNIILLFIFN
jgi:hypothetical protein